MNKPDNFNEINKNLKEVQELLKHLIAVQLYVGGATQSEICENLGISKTTVNNMVKGIKKDTKPKVKKEKIKHKKVLEVDRTDFNEAGQNLTSES